MKIISQVDAVEQSDDHGTLWHHDGLSDSKRTNAGEYGEVIPPERKAMGGLAA